jgi:hypothetical protein
MHASCPVQLQRLPNVHGILLDLLRRMSFAITGSEGGKEEATKYGFNTKEKATQRLTRLGRSGQLPWCEDDVASALPYLSPCNLVIIPTAHALLRGVLRSLLDFAFKTLVSSVPSNHPIVYNSDSRKAASVCCHFMRCLC